MSTLKGFGRGFTNCFNAFSVLFDKGLWPYMFYPLLIWLTIFIASFYGIASLVDYLMSKFKLLFTDNQAAIDNSWLSFLTPKTTGIMSVILSWIIKLIFWFFGGIFSKYILLMALSPMFAMLSERADERLTGNKFPFKIMQLLKDILRGIAISLRNLFLELFISLGLWILAILFPPLFFVTFPLGLLIGWYFTGFALMDYNCERYKLSLRESVQFVKKNKGYVIGIGCVYSIFMALPTVVGTVIGIMIAPAIGVIGAVISYLEIKKETV